ncbi:hypothetical protein BGZ63DRAFT_402038 [Mariannaea sp. PMI_226]|nr:hypothetical protein BGZ63DRAFT_402038 [Mariannaea sp. PMI_226]
MQPTQPWELFDTACETVALFSHIQRCHGDNCSPCPHHSWESVYPSLWNLLPIGPVPINLVPTKLSYFISNLIIKMELLLGRQSQNNTDWFDPAVPRKRLKDFTEFLSQRAPAWYKSPASIDQVGAEKFELDEVTKRLIRFGSSHTTIPNLPVQDVQLDLFILYASAMWGWLGYEFPTQIRSKPKVLDISDQVLQAFISQVSSAAKNYRCVGVFRLLFWHLASKWFISLSI